MKIYLDIETIPDQSEGALQQHQAAATASFKAPASLTKEQAAADLGMDDRDAIKALSKSDIIAKWEQKKGAELTAQAGEQTYRKTALNGGYGQIYCIGFAFDNGAVQIAHANTERQTLQQFFDQLTAHGRATEYRQFIGHNINDFDLRFIWQRAVINQIQPPCELLHSRYSDRVIDIMSLWAGYGNRIKLAELCNILGLDNPKDGIDGSQVWDCIQAGRGEEVQAYCKRDVAAVRAAYQKMMFQE